MRVRPAANSDTKLSVLCDENEQTIEFMSGSRRESMNIAPAATFRFDDVFGPAQDQESMFRKCGVISLIDSAIQGYACTAFAFGQTGSGKTHTISGHPLRDGATIPEGHEGLLPRSISYMFDKKRKLSDRTITFAASYIEIYKEQVIDLLRPSNKPLAVRWKSDKGFHVEKLLVLECNTEDDLQAVLEEGLSRRRTASHEMNERSSRSHSILTVYVQSTLRGSDDEALSAVYDNDIPIYGSINFVDLAGSERVKSTKAEGETLAESNTINKSLLALGNCISALSDPKKRNGYIPYRDSVLTMLLKDSLGGTSRALMIACVSPTVDSAQESSTTLRYASRAKRIQNKPQLRVEPRQMMILALKREVIQLQTECTYLRDQLTGSNVGNRTYSQDDSNDLAVITKELVETKGILQNFMADNQDLHRENVRLVNQNVEMGKQFEELLQENEMLLRVVHRESSLLERTSTQGTLWQQQGGINRQLSHSPSYSKGLTSERLMQHDQLNSSKTKGIDRSDDALRQSLENGLASKIAVKSASLSPRSRRSISKVDSRRTQMPVENPTKPTGRSKTLNPPSESRSAKSPGHTRSFSRSDNSPSTVSKPKIRRRKSTSKYAAGSSDVPIERTTPKSRNSRGYAADEGFPPIGRHHTTVSPQAERPPQVIRSKTYGGDKRTKQVMSRQSLNRSSPKKIKSPSSLEPDWSIVPDFNLRSKKQTVEEAMGKSHGSPKHKSRSQSHKPKYSREESFTNGEELDYSSLGDLDALDRQIAAMEREFTIE